ncbi:hypothetical protein DPMN_111022 [Dreissena polymorpha]|uniref:Uncharacterized protein n=1 Tax=Dreissena polymorpha TaxID=45954 RepID=A0A9D4KDR6_DREPO|nr:hypothetical protein DPMN_111022 [Dreissena polymorpha]
MRLQLLLDLGKLVNLEILEASRNLLTTVPKEIMFCKCLKLLALDRNKLVRLPRQLFVLSDLNEVSLAGNNLQYLPLDVVRLPRLRHLIVDDNVDLHYILEVPDDNNILIISKTALHASNLTAERPAVHGLHIVLRRDLPHVVLPPEFQEVCQYGTHSVPGLQELALRAVFDLMETQPGVRSSCKDLPAELSDLLQCPSAHCHVCARAMFRSAFFAA